MKSDGKFRISTACGSLDHQMFLVETRGTVGHGRGNEVSAQYVQRFGTHLKDVEPCMQIPNTFDWMAFMLCSNSNDKMRHFQMLTEQAKPCSSGGLLQPKNIPTFRYEPHNAMAKNPILEMPRHAKVEATPVLTFSLNKTIPRLSVDCSWRQSQRCPAFWSKFRRCRCSAVYRHLADEPLNGVWESERWT